MLISNPRAAGRLTLSVIALAAALATPAGAQSAADVSAAFELIRAERWAEAVNAFAALVLANPAEGTFHSNLAHALSRTGQCDLATPELREAVRLGVNGTSSAMRLARVVLAGCAAQRRDTAEALAQLDTAWQRHGLRDFSLITSGPRFASIVETDHYRALAGTPARPPADRVARWRFDLAWLDRLIRLTHPDPFRAVPERAWAAEVAQLAERITTLSDDQVIAAIMRLMARIGDGHTALYPPLQGPDAWQLLPIWPVALADGWYVAAASPDYRSLVGAKIVGAGTRSIATLDSLARTMLAADNDWTAAWLAQFPLQLAPFYQLAGAANTDGTVTLRVEYPDGRADQATVRPGPLDRDPGARWAPRDWPTMIDAPAGTPRWVRHAHAWAAMEWLPRQRVFYLALNMVDDSAGHSLARLGEALRDSMAARRATGLILDARLNNGGNGILLPGFLRPLLALPVLQEPGAFQVLTGPRSFSATVMLLHELDRFTEAERVGWPTGGRPVHLGTETPFRLPISGLTGSVATRLVVAGVDASDARPHFAPRTLVWPTGVQLRAGADPVFDAALARITGRPRDDRR